VRALLLTLSLILASSNSLGCSFAESLLGKCEQIEGYSIMNKLKVQNDSSWDVFMSIAREMIANTVEFIESYPSEYKKAEFNEKVREMQRNSGIIAILRCIDFISFMEARGYTEILKKHPRMPHFMLQKSRQGILVYRNDTSSGWFGLTAAAYADALTYLERMQEKEPEVYAEFRILIDRVAQFLPDTIPVGDILIATAYIKARQPNRKMLEIASDIPMLYKRWFGDENKSTIARMNYYMVNYSDSFWLDTVL